MKSLRARFGITAIVCLMTPALTGCVRLAKQGLHEVMGARGKLMLNNDVEPGVLKRYGRVTFARVETTLIEDNCPRELLDAYDQAYRDVSKRIQDLYPGGTPELRVTSDIQYFTEKGLLGEALLLTRVKLLAGTETIIDSLVLVKSDSYLRGGARDMARAAAKTLRKLLEDRDGAGEKDKDEDEEE